MESLMTKESRTLGGRYRLGTVIGHGGMAEVHEGTDLRLDRDVAIKVLRADLARDPAFLARFRREAQAAAGLNHPNIVSVYDTGEDEMFAGISEVKVPWIVMEKVEGVTLRHIISSGRKITPERALDIVAGVLSALDYSHRHGIVHRDIKPANIMITTQGDIKVMDFGIARALADASATMTHSNAVMGTAQYLSPEQARGEIVDARSDLYSAGCLLYELLTGQPPFAGESPVAIAYQHVSEKPVAPSQINPQLTPGVDAVVLNALAKSPNDRYHTAAEMRADVERLLQGQSPKVKPLGIDDATVRIPIVPSTEEIMSQTDTPRRTVLIVAGLAAVALVIGALVLVSRLISPSDVAQVSVPNLEGLTQEAAIVALDKVGLSLGEVTFVINENRPVGTIITQNPGSDDQVDEGTAVDVTISKGKDQVAVPTLVNFASVDDARVALMNVGLTLGSVTFEDSDLPANTVIRSDPLAGVLVDKGSPVA
ncbi:MAG: Stk1 family Ser/Thr kinase, partial [Actinomycetota bacterium]